MQDTQGSILRLGRSPEVENATPLQNFSLENSIEILEKMWAIRDWKNENKEEDVCFWTENRINYSLVG